MVTPLIGESGMIGSMTVANRLTEGTAFDDDDLRLLETLANQAAVALENGQLEQSLAELSRLKEQLRYQAYHDPLTGLANRAMFAEQVDRQLAALSDGRVLAVLFLDLDDFKVVNDTLGHAAGDRLLAAVAERIKSCIRSDDLAARLGGDEFALLLIDEDGLGRANAVASRIIEALQVSFAVAGQDLVGRRIDRHRGRARPEPADRRAAPQRRRGDVHGEGRRQAPRRGLRPDDARGDRRPPRALGGARPEHRPRRAASSTTSRSSSWRPADWRPSRRSSAGATRRAA